MDWDRIEGNRQRGSGSTPHDQHRKRFNFNCRPSSPPLSGRPRRRVLACRQARGHPGFSQPARAPLRPIPRLSKAAPLCFYHPCGLAEGRCDADGDVEILIASCSLGSPASRAFLPRRLSDAGPSRLLQGSATAGIRNPSQ
jgi:hypothetical protein